MIGAITAAVPRPVTVVTDPRYLSIAARLRGVDRVVPWGEPLPQGRCIDLQGSWASRRLTGIAARIDKRSVRRRMWLWWGGGRCRPDVPTLYGEAVGLPPRPPPWIDVPRRTRDTLVLVPGAAWEPKRAPREALVACGHAWNGPVVVLGGPSERGLCEAVAGQIEGAAVVAEEGFDETLELMARARCCVAGDSGLLHVAGACGVPVVAMFGPTHPDDGFFVYRGEVVQRELPCRPCALHRVHSCRQRDLACMDVPTEQVVAAMWRCAGS